MTREPRDETDYDQRSLANLTATIALLLVALALTWTAQQMDRWRAVERCLASGRLVCPAAPTPGAPATPRRAG
ncbi:MAG: hypothetical protein HZY79_15190 [Rhodoblastus sp.]|nr:MAG: hypothetical protein HZY79_15190 [Rhodoblastus sp.]